MSNMCKQNFAIEGMSCAACKVRVERAVTPLEGVSAVSVQLLQNSMMVHYDDEVCDTQKICAAVEKAGYVARPVTSSRDFNKVDVSAVVQQRRRLWASVILTVVLLVLSMGPMVGIDILPLAKANANTQLGLCLMVVALNFHYFKHGFKALIHFAPNMDSLVAIGATASLLASCASLIFIPDGAETAILHAHHSLYFEGVATILTLVSVGKYLEARAKNRAVDAISALYDLAPEVVTVRRPLGKNAHNHLQTYEEVAVPLESVVVGDEIVLKSGDKVGVDGVVIEGNGYFDESAITGESMQVKKGVGDKVVSATFLRHGYVIFKVEKVGSDTTLAQIIALVDEANNQKAPIARIADRVAFFFVPAVILIAILTGVFWLIEGAPPSVALNFAVAVLVVSCPCALGLATPTAIMVATGRAASLGVLFKSPEAMENLQRVDIMVFDKTGTMTVGKMEVLGYKFANADAAASTSAEQLTHYQRVALALEERSEHPIAKAIVSYCQRALSMTKVHGSVDAAAAAAAAADTAVSEFINYTGKGVSAIVDGKRYYLGSSAFMNQVLYNHTTSSYLRGKSEVLISSQSIYQDESKAVTVHLFTDKEHLLTFSIGDEIKSGAAEVVSLLRKFQVRPIMVSGDSVKVVSHVAQQVGISTFKAACLPQDKSDFIRRMQNKGHIVAMMGDGINDAPSLKTSDVGVSIVGSTDIATSCADVILMKDNLYSLVSALMLSRMTIRNIKENLFWAFIYNVICIPVAAGLFFDSLGLKLDPMIAACLMSLSSLCVVTNALRLKRCPLTAKLQDGRSIQAEVQNNDGTTTCQINTNGKDTYAHGDNADSNRGGGRDRDRDRDNAATVKGFVFKLRGHNSNNTDDVDDYEGGDNSNNINVVNSDKFSDQDLDRAYEKAIAAGIVNSERTHSNESQNGRALDTDCLNLPEFVTDARADVIAVAAMRSGGISVAAWQQEVANNAKLEAQGYQVLSSQDSDFGLGSVNAVATITSNASEAATEAAEAAEEVAALTAAAAAAESNDKTVVATATANTESKANSEGTMHKTIVIEGMQCQHCVRSVTKALSAIEGCSDVKVDLDSKTATLEVTDAVTDEQLKAAIVDNGFEVVEIK